MKDFIEAVDIVFKNLSKHETIVELDVKTLDKKFHRFLRLFEIRTQVLNQRGIGTDIILYLCFESDFPLNIPTIYLSTESYDIVKYIPHIDSDHIVCTFDSEKVLTNPNDPYGIALGCIQRAKRIIESGLEKTNINDFEEEFISYWNCCYDEKLNVNHAVLSLIENDPEVQEVKLLALKTKIRTYNYVLYQENTDNLIFKKFLEDSKNDYEEVDLFYAGELDAFKVPPFALTNKSAIDLIDKLDKEKIKEYRKKLKAAKYRMFVLFKKVINDKAYYLGWFHSKPDLSRPGFRTGSITALQALETFQSSEKTQRALPVEYNTKRINRRTSGIENEIKPLKFCIAGLGSIGSNLVPFLNVLSYPEFRLIDSDLLTIENMGRHFLGFSSVSAFKTEALKVYLRGVNPKQNVLTSESSIIDVFEKDKDFINGSDFLFVAIGKTNIENWIINKIKMGEIAKPTFVLWVEPYLLGGHCVYISPSDFKYDEFYIQENGQTFLKYNSICSSEYLKENSILSLKEAGCQTTYTPYSGSNVLLFLSSLYPKIMKIITNKTEKSVVFSWIGDKELANKMNIELSYFAKENQSFTLIENNT